MTPELSELSKETAYIKVKAYMQRRRHEAGCHGYLAKPCSPASCSKRSRSSFATPRSSTRAALVSDASARGASAPSIVGPIDRHQLLQLASQLREATLAALYEGSTLVSALDASSLELERLLMGSDYPPLDAWKRRSLGG
jgi:hypothetical protein